MKPRFQLAFVFLFALFLLVGCVKRPPAPPWVSRIQALAPPIGPEEIFKLPEGETISFAELMEDLDSVKAIFVGEVHDQSEHHQIQLKILQGLLDGGREVVLGMEMFQRFQQPILDRWTQGLFTEDEFLHEIQWETTWGVDYNLYQGILNAAKAHHLKVLALNVQREMVRKVAEKGIDRLSSEDKEKLPQMDLSNEQHRSYIASIYGGHHGGEAKNFENFYQAQVLWDESMAETLSEFLNSPEGLGKTALVLAGNGHVVFGFGIPQRFYRRIPLFYKTIVLKPWEKGLNGDLTFFETVSPPANFLWVTKPTPPEKKRPRIGVLLKETSDQGTLEIERLVPGSPAEKAGLRPGDQLLAVEGKDIKQVKDIHDVLAEKGWGKSVTFSILRNGETKEVTVILPPSRD